MSAAPDARRLAWWALTSAEDYPSRRLDGLLAEHEVGEADRALAQELVRGVARRKGTLDAVAQAYATGRLRGEDVKVALRLGLYQLLFLDRVPAHAAVATTVAAAKPELGRGTSFVNAVLRAADRGTTPLTAGDVEGASPNPELYFHDDRPGGWRFDRTVFPAKDSLAARLSYPPALLRRWTAATNEETATARAVAMNRPPALWLRVNPLRAEAAAVREALTDAGHLVQEEAQVGSHVLLRVDLAGGGITGLPGFAEGWWSVQDLTSCESLMMAAPQPGERVLDLCAAPGGKSFAAWEAMGGEGELLACDLNPRRLETMKREAARLGHEMSFAALPEVPDPAAFTPASGGAWDLLIADIPCTNTGVLHKRPEARWRADAKELHRLTTVQNLIQKQWLGPLTGENTRLLWSTCSLEAEEDGESAARLAKRTGREVLDSRLFEPDARRSGGFAALVGHRA